MKKTITCSPPANMRRYVVMPHYRAPETLTSARMASGMTSRARRAEPVTAG